MAVTPANVAVDLGRATPATGSADYQQWQQWISDALLLLRVGDRQHAGLGDLSLLDQDTVDYVVRRAVVDHVKRPDNATQVDIQVDDGRVSRRYESGKGRVVILDEWWDMLTPESAPDGAFSVRPSFLSDRVCW